MIRWIKSPDRLPFRGIDPLRLAQTKERPMPEELDGHGRSVSGMRRVLRQARLYGHLQARNGRLFHPGGNKPLCRVEMAEAMVRAGWMKPEADRYEITPEGASALALTPRLP